MNQAIFDADARAHSPHLQTLARLLNLSILTDKTHEGFTQTICQTKHSTLKSEPIRNSQSQPSDAK